VALLGAGLACAFTTLLGSTSRPCRRAQGRAWGCRRQPDRPTTRRAI